MRRVLLEGPNRTNERLNIQAHISSEGLKSITGLLKPVKMDLKGDQNFFIFCRNLEVNLFLWNQNKLL